MSRILTCLWSVLALSGFAWVAHAQEVERGVSVEPPNEESRPADPLDEAAQAPPTSAAEESPVVETPVVETPARTVARLGEAWEHHLSNGLHVVGRVDPRQKVSAVCVSYGAGSTRDPPGYSGLAVLTERLHYYGITPRFHDGIATHIPASMAHLRSDAAVFCIPILDVNLEHALHAESERMSSLLRSLREEHVRTEIELLLQSRWRPPFVERNVHQNVEEALHGHRRSVATADGLNNIELAHVQWFHQTHYGPANAVLAIVSKRPRSEIIELTERYFAHVRGVSPPEPSVREAPPVTETTRVDITGYRPRSVALYWASPLHLAEGDEALDLVAGHLGLRLRRELGSAAQRVDVRQLSSRQRSTFVVAVQAADNVDLDALRRRLELTVHAVGETLLTDAQLQAARNTFILREPNSVGRARTLAVHSQSLGTLMPFESRQTRLDSIEAPEVRDAAARFLRGHFVAVIYQHAPQRESVLVRRMP